MSPFSHWQVKGFSPKRIALKVGVLYNRKYTVFKRVRASFSPETLQVGAVKRLTVTLTTFLVCVAGCGTCHGHGDGLCEQDEGLHRGQVLRGGSLKGQSLPFVRQMYYVTLRDTVAMEIILKFFEKQEGTHQEK